MVFCRAGEKVAGGKLVRLELEHDGSRIASAKITGDFFLHPEDIISDIERALAGMQTSSSEAEFAEAIAKIAESKSAEMVGFSPEVLARLAKQAIAGGDVGDNK